MQGNGTSIIYIPDDHGVTSRQRRIANILLALGEPSTMKDITVMAISVYSTKPATGAYDKYTPERFQVIPDAKPSPSILISPSSYDGKKFLRAASRSSGSEPSWTARSCS